MSLREVFRVASTVVNSIESMVESIDPAAGAVVGRGLNSALSMTGALADIVSDPAQLQRLIELLEQHDFAALIRALSGDGPLEPDFFASFSQRAGGYFPKLCQVLSVRADLSAPPGSNHALWLRPAPWHMRREPDRASRTFAVHDRATLEALGRCMEEMPARPLDDVVTLLRREGFADATIAGLGECLSAGSIAQVHVLGESDRGGGVLKVAWPETRERMAADFRLFAHARGILRALSIPADKVQAVAAIFEAVGRSEAAVRPRPLRPRPALRVRVATHSSARVS